MKRVHISELEPELQTGALVAFAKLADDQRGTPEQMGGGGSYTFNPAKTHAMGLWLHASEHVGDIIHRMSQKMCERITYGYDFVGPKVDGAIRILRHPYGYAREVEENLRDNFRHVKPDIDYQTWVKQWEGAATAYAEAHRALTVYNEAQFHAREAAVEIGMRNYDLVQYHLEIIEAKLETPEDWVAYAGQVTINDAGRIEAFSRGLVESSWISRLEQAI